MIKVEATWTHQMLELPSNSHGFCINIQYSVIHVLKLVHLLDIFMVSFYRVLWWHHLLLNIIVLTADCWLMNTKLSRFLMPVLFFLVYCWFPGSKLYIVYWCTAAVWPTKSTEHYAMHSGTDNKSWNDWWQISYRKHWTKSGIAIVHFSLFCVHLGLSLITEVI